eukprot:m.4518 g.4518  ORF g.4518 m.4518 type:complete len:406 (+) comp3004_c0_seq1:56-1273(+)
MAVLLERVLVILVAVIVVCCSNPPQFTVQITGPPVTTFNTSIGRCVPLGEPLNCDNVDTPARAWVTSSGEVRLTASCRVSRLMEGNTLDSVKHSCHVVHNSTHNADPSQYSDNEWLHAIRALDNSTVFAILHNEYHGYEHNNCNMNPWKKGYCQQFALTGAISYDNGNSWEYLAPPPKHLIAAVPYKYVNNDSNLWFGFGDTGGIVKHPTTEYYYTTGHNRATIHNQINGTCLMRTNNLLDTSSWRGWNGTHFGATFINPYTDASEDGHLCVPLEDMDNGLPRGAHHQPLVNQGLVWSDYLNSFVGVFWNTGHDVTLGNGYAFLVATSKDLLTWSTMKPLYNGSNSEYQHFYPTLLDPGISLGYRNFDVIGKQAELYFTQAAPKGTSMKNTWNSLVRIPIEFETF